MAYPKKRKGWRKIVVDGREFRWRFTEDEYVHALLAALGTESNGQMLEVTVADYFSWIDFADGSRQLKQGLISITPKLAAEAIRFGLANGWHPDKGGFPVRAVYENCDFRLIPAPSRKRKEKSHDS